MSNFDTNIMDWDSAIESDGQQFIVLPEGDYSFTVTGFERGRYPGSTKIPPCNKASLTLTIELPDGQVATCREDLILYRTIEWKLASFFRAIGQKKTGERVVMDWTKVMGARGRAHFKPRAYIKDGSEHTINSVDHYYDPEPQAAQPDWVRQTDQAIMNGSVQQMQAPYQPQAQPVPQQQMSWKNGGF